MASRIGLERRWNEQRETAAQWQNKSGEFLKGRKRKKHGVKRGAFACLQKWTLSLNTCVMEYSAVLIQHLPPRDSHGKRTSGSFVLLS